jgi:methyltransferase (TIGR00027 family)
MKEGKPSFTAEGTVAMRYAEWLAPEDKRKCSDPMAKDFVPAKFRILGKSRVGAWIAIRTVEWLIPGMIAYIVGRTKLIDEYVAQRIDEGIDQMVVMGAGYDSRAYRFAKPGGRAKVFEVDFLATQEVKKAKVRKLLGSLPDHVVYVPVDFDEVTLGDGLFAAGFDRSAKTLFTWEGVTPYITPQGMDETLAFVAKNSGPGSSIILDYIYISALDGTFQQGQVRRIRKAWELIARPITSESFTYGIPDGTIEEFLTQRGFRDIVDTSGEFFESAHAKGPYENLRVWHVVHANVAGQEAG